MAANITKGKDEGEIDVGTLKPPARRDSTAAREHNEAAAFKKTDGRELRRKGRTELISWRIYPQTRQTMERIAKAEGITLIEVLERGIDLLDKQLRGK